MQKQQQWQCRWSPTLGALEDTHQNVWGTTDYKNDTDPTVFFGLYGLPDFYALWRHKGRKAILWAGTDIIHFKNGYWLDEKEEICLDYIPLAEWINKNCESYVENESEQKVLAECFIGSKIVPSFLGDVNKFEVSFKPGNKLYFSISGNDLERYNWNLAQKLIENNKHIEFHIYGNTIPIKSLLPNVVMHGRVPKEQMNKEIKEMQGCLRLIEMEGFSEIVAKAMLMGQRPISIIQYPYTLPVVSIGIIPDLDKPNLKGREWVVSNVNKYPWVTK